MTDSADSTADVRQPLVPVLSTSHLKAWPKHDTGARARYLPLPEALTTQYRTDVHTAAYSAPTVERRLSRDAVSEIAGGVCMALVVFDIDGDEHKGSDEWFKDERGAIFDLVEARASGDDDVHPPFVYRTRGGYRIVFRLERPIYIRDAADAAAWTALYAAWAANLRRRFGIAADLSCKDWQRLFRLPHATRDDNTGPEDREVIGDPKNIGTWHCELSAEDMATPPKKVVRASINRLRNIGRTSRGRLVDAFDGRGMLDREVEPGMWAAECPWESSHTGGATFDSSTVIYAADDGDLGFFRCSHAHCVNRSQADVIAQFSDEEMDNPQKCGDTTKGGKVCAATELHTDGKCVFHSATAEARKARREHVAQMAPSSGAASPGDRNSPRLVEPARPQQNQGAATEPAAPVGRALILPAARAMTIGGAQRVPTGFAALDANTRGGLRVGKRVVIGGAPGAGKTTWLAQLLWRCAERGAAVMLICFDEEAEDVLIRIGQINGLNRDDLERGDEEARTALADILEATPTFLLVDGDEEEMTVEQASAELARRRQPGQLSVFGVDSVQTARVVGDLDADSAKSRVDLVMKALKLAGKVDKHLVLATCELNRGGYRSQNPSERVDDLAAFKESGGVEYGATMAMVMRSLKDSEGVVDVSVPKNRMGKKKPFRLQLDFTTASFTEGTMPTAEEEEAIASPMQKAKEKLLSVVEKSIQPITSASELARRGKVGKSTTLKAVKELIEDGRLRHVGGVFVAVPVGSGTGSEPLQAVTGSAVPALKAEPGTGTATGTSRTGLAQKRGIGTGQAAASTPVRCSVCSRLSRNLEGWPGDDICSDACMEAREGDGAHA